MITADDARALVKEAETGDYAAATALVRCWNGAIEQAARAGKSRVREANVFMPRTPVSVAAREIAHEHLRNAGFTVASVPDGPNETAIEVSW